MTIYVVSGHPRSGTSMMMGCLQAGGMTAAYSSARDDWSKKYGQQASGFNRTGLFELTMDLIKAPEFPALYEGCVVKLVWDWLRWLKPYEPGYRVIMMIRHPEEVRQSFEATISDRKNLIAENYDKRLMGWVERLTIRPDVFDLVMVHYSEAIYDPIGCMTTLAERGWPIDPAKAAAIVDPRLYRFRLNETIVEGA